MGACTTCHLVLHWWSGCRDLNPGPLRPERSALPSCATARSELPRSPPILAGDRRIEQSSDDRRHLWRDGLVVLDDDLTDPSSFDRLHSECPVLVGVGRHSLRDLASEIEDKASERNVLPLGYRDTECLFNLINVGLAVNEPTVFADANDRRFFVLIELVVQVAHQLLEDVADRHDAGDAAVCVEYQGERSSLRSHLAEAL